MYEPVSAVSEFVSSCLETPLPHILADSVTGARLGEAGDTSLLDLGIDVTHFKCIVFIHYITRLGTSIYGELLLGP